MKLKGIHPAEQHFDKILVGVLGVAALGIVATQFLIPVNNVKVGAGESVPPEQAFRPVEREASTLVQRLETREPRLPDQVPPGLGDSLTAVLNPVTVNPGTGVPLGPQLALGGISASSGVIANASYAAPVPPAPTGVVTSSFRGAIDPQESVRTPGLAAFLPAQQPFDKAAVSIEARFNGEELARLLQEDPDGDGPMQPMPLSWWRDPQTQGRYLVDIVAIEVQRETLRTADGVTPPGETLSIVQTMPGRFNGRAYWNERVRSLGDVSMELTALEQRAEEIRRPQYYAMIAGFPWEPPSEVVPPEERGDRAREVERARRQLTDLDGRLQRMREQLGASGSRPPPSRDNPPGASPGRSGGGRGMTPGGGGGGGGRTPPPRDDNNNQPNVNPEVLQRQITRLEGERAKLVERLRGLGESVDGDTGVPGSTNPEATPTIGVLEDDSIRVWSHDIFVEPGAQYRYRVRVVMNNPLFGRGLKEEQSALSEQKLIESDWSEWSSPVDVDRDRYFFVTSAEDRSQVTGRPRASAELIVFYYGYYRSASVGLEPGDAITATVRLPADLKLADMDKLRDFFKDQPADAATPPPMAPPQPGRTPGGPSGRTPGGPGMTPGATPSPRDRDPRDPRNPGGAAPVDVPPSAEWMTIDAEDRVELSEDAVLLDVGRVAATTAAAVPGGNTTRFKAILRRASGALDVRIPEEDRASALYKRLNSSVRAGIAATAPAPTPLPDRPATPTPTPRAPEPPRRSPGGGGGGGGGGAGGG